jgi:uncharacterized protein (DUF1778 family)
MSERKTAEIKFRCTPTFKAGLQAAADAAGESMSEYIESAVWAKQNEAIDGTKLVDNAIAQLEEADDQGADVPDGYCCAAGFRCSPNPCPWHSSLQEATSDDQPDWMFRG